MGEWEALEFTPEFVQSLIARKPRAAEAARVERGLTRLAFDETHPSLRVHKLRGEFEGEWSAGQLPVAHTQRVRKRRGGRKLLLDLTHHYDD